MRILIFSHSYLEPENRKNIYSLLARADVKCVLPQRGPVLLFADHTFIPDSATPKVFHPLKALRLLRSQYVLLGLGRMVREYRPEIIVIEYNPWSMMFLQALIARSLYSRDSMLVCFVKKNTYEGGVVKGLVAKWAVKRVDHIIAASHVTAKLLKRRFAIDPGNVSVCHHLGVDLELFRPAMNSELVLGDN